MSPPRSRSRKTRDAITFRFSATGSPTEIPIQRRGSFQAQLTEGGVNVSKLGTQPLLPWAAFEEAIVLLERRGGRAPRGNAMVARLGDPDPPLDSVEGQVARVVFRARLGLHAFRRITTIAGSLIWAGLCRASPGELVLVSPHELVVVLGASLARCSASTGGAGSGGSREPRQAARSGWDRTPRGHPRAEADWILRSRHARPRPPAPSPPCPPAWLEEGAPYSASKPDREGSRILGSPQTQRRSDPGV